MISFTFTRDLINIESSLTVRASLGGTAIPSQYIATGIDSVAGDIATIVIPANETKAQITFTPAVGSSGPNATLSVTVVGDVNVSIDAGHPTAVGTLVFGAVSES